MTGGIPCVGRWVFKLRTHRPREGLTVSGLPLHGHWVFNRATYRPWEGVRTVFAISIFRAVIEGLNVFDVLFTKLISLQHSLPSFLFTTLSFATLVHFLSSCTIKEWFRKVRESETRIEEIRNDDGRKQTGLFNGLFPYLRNRNRLSRQAKKMTEDVKMLIDESSKFNEVAFG
ncbi:hypothetical protein Fmac_010509 [Flemingia macrophylla]|uniref:Uncharacterized protein n=1 Tax=Flemingia macrophylla TaxID=520843 RepID=A0ABD1MKM1_9FABA